MFTASAINYWDDRRDNSSNLQLSLCRNTPGMVLDCSYTSDNQIFGINGLAQISKQIAVGGEVFYTQKEKSGGISIGTRLSTMTKNHLRSIATFVCNPIMGHFSFSFGADVSKNMKMATRYDFNMYSYDSDLSFGVEYAPENSKQVLKGRISFSNGLGLSLSGMFQQILYTIGMETSFGPNPAQNFGIEIEIF
jgi:distribution and morphology protein 10